MTAESIAGPVPRIEQTDSPHDSLLVPYVDVDTLSPVEVEPEASPHEAISIFTSNQSGKDGPRVATLANRLRTEVFLDRGHIKPRQVDALGFYNDDYESQSVYYYVKNTEKAAAARVIHVMPVEESTRRERRDHKRRGILALPTCKEFSIDHTALAEAAGVENIADLKSDEVVEISGLAAQRVKTPYSGKTARAEKHDDGHGAENFDAVISLYSKMMRDSLESGHKLWVMNTDEGLIRLFRGMLGEEQVRQIGESRTYMGDPTTPVAISPHAVMREIFGNKDRADEHQGRIMHLKEILKGVDARKVPDDIQVMFEEHGVEFERVRGIRKMSKKELALHAGVLAYSASRGLPTLAVEEFDGSTATLVSIDLATSLPYSMGMVEMYKNQSLAKKAIGAAVAIPSFFAPYAYFWAEQGQGYPGYVNGIAAAFLGGAAMREVAGRRGRARQGKRLAEQLDRVPR